MSDLLVEGFEAGSNQNLSGYNGWTGTSTSSLYVTDGGEVHGGNRALQITYDASSVLNYKAWSGSVTGEALTTEFYFYLTTVPTSGTKHLLTPSDGVWNWGEQNFSEFLYISSSGWLYRYNDDNPMPIVQLSTGQWYHIESQYNLDENPDTWEIWVNDTHYGPWTCCNNGATVAGFTTQNAATSGAEYYIDDAKVYEGSRTEQVFFAETWQAAEVLATEVFASFTEIWSAAEALTIKAASLLSETWQATEALAVKIHTEFSEVWQATEALAAEITEVVYKSFSETWQAAEGFIATWIKKPSGGGSSLSWFRRRRR